MSSASGKQALINILQAALKEDTRAKLDTRVHIADLNKNTLIRANRLDFTSANAASSEFTASYKKFIDVVTRLVPGIDKFNKQQSDLTDVELAMSIVSNEKIKTAHIWLEKERLLVSSGFSSMSTLRTKIYSDPAIINDIYFGKSNRVRSIYDQLKDRGIELDIDTIPDESTLTSLLKSTSAKDSLYIFPDMGTKNAFGDSKSSGGLKVHRLTSKKEGKKSIGMLVKVSEVSYDTVAIPKPDGTVRFESAKKYIGYKVAEESTGDISVYPNPESSTDAVLLDKRLLSVADIGHAYFIDRATGQTPASEKLKIPKEIVDAFTDTQLQRVNTELAKLQKRLNKAHGAVDFAFYKQTIQDKLSSATSGTVSINDALLVVFQDYKVNNKLSSVEKKILSKFVALVTREILKVPGSNTLKQDLIDIYSDKTIAPLLKLGNKTSKKLVPTSNLTVKQDINFTTSVRQDRGTSSKISRSKANVNIPRTRLRTTQGTFTSLASLQTLLNLALHDQIRKNMGTGTSKNILNYRSGRLAESAEVTSMSQSREGMITAFYTYMRNPYATFSQGGVQGSPPSRDPKLLISKSIREVLATQVNNRLRAVLA